MTSTETRLADIEQILSHQDQQINDLSDMVNQQWSEIDRLKKLLSQARNRLENLENPDEAGSLADDRPPHY